MKNKNSGTNKLVIKCQECEKIGINDSWYSKDDWEKLSKLNDSFAHQYTIYQKAEKENNLSHGSCPNCKEEIETREFNCIFGKTHYRENKGNYGAFKNLQD